MLLSCQSYVPICVISIVTSPDHTNMLHILIYADEIGFFFPMEISTFTVSEASMRNMASQKDRHTNWSDKGTTIEADTHGDTHSLLRLCSVHSDDSECLQPAEAAAGICCALQMYGGYWTCTCTWKRKEGEGEEGREGGGGGWGERRVGGREGGRRERGKEERRREEGR